MQGGQDPVDAWGAWKLPQVEVQLHDHGLEFLPVAPGAAVRGVETQGRCCRGYPA
eukprot:CAMPEP_0206148176 /NCGR_PEP_ID=MMETSP1473-20131121/35822_1 /ASSEMBLY_ACC=CAM_ASM_001109 /TAXON_ID=1461547 /ORGANISM="Stichococcus sp, Strain RCC1054" /LENGTH=54 /DNA_ID=CAMNT_0053545421 /DNA_START=535 /DNA_END=699 /DNA_ORIENTATION=-